MLFEDGSEFVEQFRTVNGLTPLRDERIGPVLFALVPFRFRYIRYVKDFCGCRVVWFRYCVCYTFRYRLRFGRSGALADARSTAFATTEGRPHNIAASLNTRYHHLLFMFPPSFHYSIIPLLNILSQ